MEGLSSIEKTLAYCAARKDKATMIKLLLMQSLLCELDKRFGASNELIEDVATREKVVKALVALDSTLLGVTVHGETIVLPFESLAFFHDNN